MRTPIITTAHTTPHQWNHNNRRLVQGYIHHYNMHKLNFFVGGWSIGTHRRDEGQTMADATCDVDNANATIGSCV